MEQKCRIFHRPHLLWAIDDKEVDSLAQRVNTTGINPVCKFDLSKSGRRPSFGQAKRKWEFSLQNGQCVEGSRCRCPNLNVKGHETAASIRGAANRMFVAEGAASGPAILKQYGTGLVVSTVVINGIIGGAFVGSSAPMMAALGATLANPVFLAVGTVVLTVKIASAHASFQCQDFLGCWPVSAQKVRNGGCRLSTNAKTGGSPVWFLPLPGTKLEKKWTGSCKRVKCKPGELRSQIVGQTCQKTASRTRHNLYNCQPLPYSDMNRAQKRALWESLNKTSLPREYGITQLAL